MLGITVKKLNGYHGFILFYLINMGILKSKTWLIFKKNKHGHFNKQNIRLGNLII